ncbi:MAG: hypothetical protein PWP27_809 [Clostridiales bacterium]|jgi:hypothetical protein|nr:hypothetical protein [Clostridiales bacterium]MDK2932999.1 hypothetical protein [Clostridiales bacterium]
MEDEIIDHLKKCIKSIADKLKKTDTNKKEIEQLSQQLDGVIDLYTKTVQSQKKQHKSEE